MFERCVADARQQRNALPSEVEDEARVRPGLIRYPRGRLLRLDAGGFDDLLQCRDFLRHEFGELLRPLVDDVDADIGEALLDGGIAQRLGISTATVGVQISRGMEKCTCYLRSRGVTVASRRKIP